MPNTPKGLTYPSNSSPVAVPADIQELAEDVDGLIVPNTGGTYTGSVSFTNSPSVPTPTSALHAVNKTYADLINTDVTALETELGSNPSGTFSTVKDRLDSYTTGFATVGNLLTANQASGGDTLGDTTGFAGAVRCTLEVSNAVTYDGRRTLKMTKTAAEYAQFNLGSYAVRAGETWTHRAMVYVPSGQTLSVITIYHTAPANIQRNYYDAQIPRDQWVVLEIATPFSSATLGDAFKFTIEGQDGLVVYFTEFGRWLGAGGEWAMPGLPIVGGSRIAVNNAVDLSGTGVPNGNVTAAPGSSFLQIGDAVTVSGNLLWRKVSGTGNTGWEPEGALADTGWRDVSADATVAGLAKYPNIKLAVRRVGTKVVVQVYTGTGTTDGAATTNVYTLPTGFMYSILFEYRSTVGSAINATTGVPSPCGLYSGGSSTVIGQLADSGAGNYVTGYLEGVTDDGWPTSLPGTAL